MTSAIEQTKRAYAQAMHDMTHHASGCGPSTVERLRALEDATEEYLELLRQDHEALHETARKRFEDVQALEAGNEKLSKALRYTNETIQRCAAQSLETIRDLQQRIDNQAGLITKLDSRVSAAIQERDDLQLRLHAVDHAYKVQQERIATPMSEQGDRGAIEQPDANMTVVIAAVRGAQDIMAEYLVPDGIRAKRAMTKLIPLLDNETLYSALYELERSEDS